MDIGFTESKEDSNLYFKVEGRRTMILYVDEMFLIGGDDLIAYAKRRLDVEF